MAGSEAAGLKGLFNQSKEQACAYSAFRPDYPLALYEAIFKFAQLEAADLALDVATGTGQAATVLAQHFKKVIAIDPSKAQLEAAAQVVNIVYREATAESTALESGSCDLVTVAQAVHWFDLPAFYREARRVLRPSGTLAMWGYDLGRFVDCPAANEHMWQLYDGTLGPFWSERRLLVEQHYVGMEPDATQFGVVERVDLTVKKTVPLSAISGLVSSWSSYNTYRTRHPDKPDPLPPFEAQLMKDFGASSLDKQVDVLYPIFCVLAKQPLTLQDD